MEDSVNSGVQEETAGVLPGPPALFRPGAAAPASIAIVMSTACRNQVTFLEIILPATSFPQTPRDPANKNGYMSLMEVFF